MKTEPDSDAKLDRRKGDLTQIVAIDGPAGAGKSTVSKEVARRMDMAFLDSGAMYRAATWWAMDQGISLDDPEALARCTEDLPLDMREEDGNLRVFVDGREITDEIRTPEVTRNIKYLDGIQAVRTPLVRIQRVIAASRPTVAEGRDMGTVVFPKARCKIYLDATIEERSRRRAKQLDEQGTPYDPAVLRAEIEERDNNDMTRKVAPLQKAADAHILDTSSLSFEEVVQKIVQLAEAAL